MSETRDAIKRDDLEAGLNAEFPHDLLVICILCEHLDWEHVYGVARAATCACSCCKSLYRNGTSAIPARFERRSLVEYDLLTGHGREIRRPLTGLAT